MDERVRPILEAGFGAHQAGELEIAEGNYRHALKIAPENSDALHLLGVVLMQQGDMSSAEASIKHSLEIEPNNPSALDHLGVMLADSGKLREAISCFAQALHLAPDYGSCWRNFAYTNELARDWPGAAKAYKKAIALDHSYVAAHYGLGGVLLQIGDFEEALKSFESAISINPRDKSARIKRAETLRRLRRFNDAKAAYYEAFSLPEERAFLAQNLGFCHAEEGNDTDALREFNKSLKEKPGAIEPSLGAAACLMRQGELAEAATRLDSVLDHTPIHNQTLTFRSILHQLAGEKDKASRITNFDQDISIALLPIPEEFSDSSHFNSALASALMNNPTLSTDPHAKSTRGGKQSGELAIFDNPVVTRFVTTLDNFLREYLISLKLRPDHPHYKTIPKHYGLDCWSTILRSEGYQLPHIHTSAWLSGVYYVQLPPEINNRDKSHSGWIEFGGSGFNLPKHSGSLRLIAPKVGNLILFPSYFLHRTVPFHSKRPRISIAFDIVPKV